MNISTLVVPDLWHAIRRSYESEAWSSVMLDAMHLLSDVIRSKSGLHSDGTVLAGQAFGIKDPKIKLNRLISESDKNVQAGMEQIIRGLYQAVRNPRSHGRLDDSQADAEAIVIFINYLLGQLGHAKSVFSIDDVLTRLIDKNFVPNKRYAELILLDIPKAKLLDTLIASFGARDHRDAKLLKEFFAAGISALDDADRQLFFDAVSSELRDSDSESGLRSALQVLLPKHWPSVGEAARLRSENRIIKDMATGKYDSSTSKVLSGGLATWAISYFSRFTLKQEVMGEIYGALVSKSRERQDYMLRFFFPSADALLDVPSAYFVKHVSDKLKAGDKRYYDAVERLTSFTTDAWEHAFDIPMKSFKAKNDVAPLPDFADDDIPF